MDIKIGCHVGLKAPEYYFGSVKEALSYNASAFMLYTGAPQNSKRVPLEQLKINEAFQLWQEQGYANDSIVVHAPYIINLSNSLDNEKLNISKQILKIEIERTKAMGCKYLVLHPGSYLEATLQSGIDTLANSLNEVVEDDSVIVCLETMAGKGKEVGRTFQEIAQVIEKVNKPIGVCLDTCHIHDGGYNLNHLDEVLNEFDKTIGLDKLHVIHVNDSKNEMGSHKDRHENIGKGFIGFDNLFQVVHSKKLEGKIFILETPYVDGYPIYKEEIQKLRGF